MAAYGQMPSANPEGGSLSVDEVQVGRVSPQNYDIVQLVKDAIEVVKAKPTEAIVYPIGMGFIFFFVYFIFSLVGQFVMFPVSMLAIPLSEIDPTLATIVVTGLTLVIALVMMAIQTAMIAAFNLAMYMFYLRIARGQEVSIDHLKELKPFVVPAILTSLLFQLTIFGGILMLIIPGYIFMIGFFFAPVMVLDKRLSPVNAMKASWRLTDGHKLNIFLFFIVTGILNMVGMLACGLGLFVTIPITWVAMMSFYDKLAEPGNAYMGNGAQVAQVFT